VNLWTTIAVLGCALALVYAVLFVAAKLRRLERLLRAHDDNVAQITHEMSQQLAAQDRRLDRLVAWCRSLLLFPRAHG